MRSTIFALSSAAGQAGVAVIRVSGPRAADAFQLLSGKTMMPAPRRATLVRLRDPMTEDPIDQALVIWFPDKSSFSGEPLVEFHVHGGRAVLVAVFHVLSSQEGFRIAAPGEFTRRAFENGKLDLTQAEAIADLIAADTLQQRKHALRGMGGAVGRLVAGWRDVLLQASALIAAEIDFSDEGDVGESASDGVDSLLQQLKGDMQQVMSATAIGRVLQDGFRVAIVGKPNSGKSSLLNALAGEDVAIVTEFAGTTRDVISVKLEIGGYPFVLQDTAGIRISTDPVERIGIDRSIETAENADIVLHLSADGDWQPLHPSIEGLDLIRIRSKSDLGPAVSDDMAECAISVVSEHGLRDLYDLLLALVAPMQSTSPIVTNARQKKALASALQGLERALEVPRHYVEFLDHEIRSVINDLDTLVGRVGVEEVLGAVFSRFCVGK